MSKKNIKLKYKNMEVLFMKTISKKTFTFLARIAESNAKMEADSACILWGYQPRIPEKLLDNNKIRSK